MTREERWLRAEMAPLERITDAECLSMPPRQLAHFKRRLDVLRSLLEMVASGRRREDAFFGGYCSALSAGLYGEDGTDTRYVEAVEAAGAEKLLRWARANDEMELPRIRQAVKCIRERHKREARR